MVRIPQLLQRCGAVVRVFKTGSVTISDGWFSSDDAAGNALLVQDSGKARVNGGWFESQFGDAAVKVESPDADVELSKARIYARYQCSIIVPEGSAITSVDDLFNAENAFNIGVQIGTTGDLYISGDVEANGLKHSVERFNKYHDAFAALASGKIALCDLLHTAYAGAAVNYQISHIKHFLPPG